MFQQLLGCSHSRFYLSLGNSDQDDEAPEGNLQSATTVHVEGTMAHSPEESSESSDEQEEEVKRSPIKF